MTHSSRKTWKTIRILGNDQTKFQPGRLVTDKQVAHQHRGNPDHHSRRVKLPKPADTCFPDGPHTSRDSSAWMIYVVLSKKCCCCVLVYDDLRSVVCCCCVLLYAAALSCCMMLQYAVVCCCMMLYDAAPAVAYYCSLLLYKCMQLYGVVWCCSVLLRATVVWWCMLMLCTVTSCNTQSQTAPLCDRWFHLAESR